MKISKLRDAGDILGRQGMSELVFEYVKSFDGSYKGAMKLAGKLSVIAKMATCDEYWAEKVSIGERSATAKAETILENHLNTLKLATTKKEIK